MKIAVDCYEVKEFPTGVGRVIDNILVHLVNILSGFDFFVITPEKNPKYHGKNIRQYVLPSHKGYFRWQNGPFFKKLKEIKPDLVIAPNYTLPIFNRWESILIEHDVSFTAHPEWFSRRDAIKRRFLTKRSLKKASLVITVSEFSKSEIIKKFKINQSKIRVLYHGIEEKFQRSPVDEITEWREQQGLTGKRIVGYLGSIFNRRNIPLLVESVSLLRETLPETFLYIVGQDLSHPPQNIAQLLSKDWIRWETSIKESDLSLFYSSLDVFVYLSEYEGFGLPPLEALACGTASVLLNKSSLKEIYKDMAIMVDDPEANSVKEALITALKDDTRKQKDLSRFNEERHRFSWERVAQEFSLIIRDLIK